MTSKQVGWLAMVALIVVTALLAGSASRLSAASAHSRDAHPDTGAYEFGPTMPLT